jgi:hypothetical protein
MLGLGLGLNKGGVKLNLISRNIAVAHQLRILAVDSNSVLPVGVNTLAANIQQAINAALPTVITSAAEFNDFYPVYADPHYTGYLIGAGSGVSLGRAAQKVFAINPIADFTQTTAASQPLLLTHNGDISGNYWFGSGVSGNYCSTPNAAANIIAQNLELAVYNIQWKGAASIKYLISKTNTYSLSITSTNFPVIEYRVAGTTLVALATSSIGTTFNGAIKVFRDSTTGNITFYTSSDNVNFSQLGAIVLGTSGVISNLIENVFIGSYNNSSANWEGLIGRATIATSLGGTPVVEFNPQNYNASTSQTQWTSSTGEVWTINTGTATTGYKGVLVDRTILQGDGIDDLILTGNIDYSSTDKITMYSAVRKLSTTLGLFATIGSNTNRCSAIIDGAKYRVFNVNGGVDNDYSTVANNTLLTLFSNTTDRSLAAASKQNMYYNNVLQSKTANSAGNCVGNYSNAPASLFSRLDGIAPSNNILNTIISCKIVNDSTQQAAIYSLIRLMSNNAF